MAIIEIREDNFEKEVLQSDRPVLVDFWASWCGPCKMMAPVLDELAATHPEVKVGKINVDEQGSLAMKYRIMSIPTLIVMKGGKVVEQAVGARGKQDVAAMIERHL